MHKKQVEFGSSGRGHRGLERPFDSLLNRVRWHRTFKASSLWSPLGLACPCLGFHGLVSSCAGFHSLACGCLGFSCSCFACLVFSCHVLVCPKWREKQTQHEPKLASFSVPNRLLGPLWGGLLGVLGHSWAASAVQGPRLGLSWAALGGSWAQHGANMGPR